MSGALLSLVAALLLSAADGPVQIQAPVIQPRHKVLVIRQLPDPRAVSRLTDVRNASVRVETSDNYLKSGSLKLLKQLRPLPLRIVLDDAITRSHVRQIRFLDGADIGLRVSERFLTDPQIVARLHELGPVAIELTVPPEITVAEAFWMRAAELKQVSLLVKLGPDAPEDPAMLDRLARRPPGWRLTLEIEGLSSATRRRALLRARPDRLALRVEPDKLTWDLIDDLNESLKIRKVLVIPPMSITDDHVLRLNGVRGATLRIEGAEYLGLDAILRLNRVGR